MAEIQHRTIEDRLEEIEHGVHEIKSILLKLNLPKSFTADKLMDEYINVKDLASFAKIEPSIIYAACARKELKFVKLGKLYKFKRQEVLEWLEKKPVHQEINVDEYVERYLQKNVIKG